ncbi:MAG: M28 family peptidase [Candidatus Omnitrophica bacterium]|nr:M28 family peptidase [Candidatus Omnitrophota bacterium]
MMAQIWRYIFRLTLAAGLVYVLVSASSFGWMLFPLFWQNQAELQGVAVSLEKSVRHLSEEIGVRNYSRPDNLEKAARYVERSFEAAGLPVESWEYEAQGQKFRNVVAKYQNNPSPEYWVVGAHYDSCFNPGADDNASGVAGLLWLADALKKVPLKANILFVAFTNEEPPFFASSSMGSRVFVQAAQERRLVIRGAIVLEMIGYYSNQWFSQKYLPPMGLFYPNRGNFVALVGSFGSGRLVESIQADFSKQKYILTRSVLAPAWVPGLNLSDHASFWAAGLPAVMVTDTAFLRNSNYHQSTDTFGRLDYNKMAAVVAGLKSAVISLSER